MKMIATCSIVAILLLSGCQSSADEGVEGSQTENQGVDQVEDYTFEDYKAMFKDSVSEAEAFEVQEDNLEKWIARTIYQSKRNGNDNVKEEAVLEQAKEALQQQEDRKRYAQETYGVQVTEEEVDRYIEEGPDQLDVMEQKAAAEAIGMTPEEFNHTYDRDHYEMAVLYEKLLPELRKKYDEVSDGNLIERFKEEVEKE